MNNTLNKHDHLEERLIAFAASIVALSTQLPTTRQGRHICDQILRSGTAVAANYAEARGAESRADFIHKLKIVSKELNETVVWLEISARSSMLSQEKLFPILTENRELCRIIGASIRTARAKEN